MLLVSPCWVPCGGLAFHPGGVVILLVASRWVPGGAVMLVVASYLRNQTQALEPTNETSAYGLDTHVTFNNISF